MRHDLEEIFAQPIAEVAGDPVEQRVAAADQHRVLVRERLAHLPQRHAHVRLERPPSAPAPTRAATGSTARPGSGRPTAAAGAPARSNRRAHHRRSPGSPASIGHRSTSPSLIRQPRCREIIPTQAVRSGIVLPSRLTIQQVDRADSIEPVTSRAITGRDGPSPAMQARDAGACESGVAVTGCSPRRTLRAHGSSQSPIRSARTSAWVRWGWWPTVGRITPFGPGQRGLQHVEIAARDDPVFVALKQEDLGRNRRARSAGGPDR